MKKFQFRLETLLTKAQIQEELALQEFNRVKQALKELQDQLTALFDERRRHQGTPPRPVTVANLEVHNAYARLLTEKMEELKKRIREQQKAVEAAKDRLTKKHRERRSVETLKERDLEQHQYEARREETKQLDEFSVLRYKGDKEN